MLSVKPAFSLSSLACIKKLFNSSSFPATKMVISACLRLLTFLPAILTPACDSSNLAFHKVYSAYKLNKQGYNIHPCTLFPVLNQSVFLCLVLTVASWPVYRFLRRQVRWSGVPISLTVFQSLLWSTQSKVVSMNHSQWSKSRCFSGILLLFLWSNECRQFDLWFLCLF